MARIEIPAIPTGFVTALTPIVRYLEQMRDKIEQLETQVNESEKQWDEYYKNVGEKR